MKRFNYISLSLSAALLCGSFVLFVNARDSSVVSDEQPLVSVASEVPDFPLTVQWAGQKVDLSRYDMYERYDRELTAFCYTHSTTLQTIKRANRIFPLIEPVLKANGVPTDLKYLAAVESSLNIRAYSPANAAGIWQFVPATAKQFGLEVNDYVDERYDPVKATEAACRYLKSAYAKYGNWTTVAASYNGGMGRITRELAKQQADTSFDLWLNDETSRYVFRILALKNVMDNPQKFGYVIKSHQLNKPIRTKEVVVDKPIEDWAVFAKENGITFAQLREFNLWIRDMSLPNKTGKAYTVRIPLKEDMYYTKKDRKSDVYQKNWVID